MLPTFRISRPTALLTAALALAAGLGCGQEILIDRPANPEQTDSFQQLKASSIDILFVIDNSRSMFPHQEALATNFARFLEHLDPDPDKGGEPGEVDYRIAIATTDIRNQGGLLQGQPAVLRPGAGYNPVEVFAENVMVGIEGQALERGLQAAELALEAAGKLRGSGGERLFLRPNAFLYLIFLSDEDDNSFGEIRYFQRRFESIKGIGNENTVVVSAIAGPVPGGCETARPGTRYHELTQLTGGVLGNLCTEDWSQTLRELAFTGLGLRKRFQLKYPVENFDGSGVVNATDFRYIRVNYPCDTPDEDPHLREYICSQVERACPSGNDEPSAIRCYPYWDEDDGVTYDRRENTLVFSGAAVPGPGSTVEARYTPRTK